MIAADLARQLDVPTNRVTELLNGRRAITGDTALATCPHFFGTTAEFWLNLQRLYEQRLAQKKAGKSKQTYLEVGLRGTIKTTADAQALRGSTCIGLLPLSYFLYWCGCNAVTVAVHC